MTGWLTFALLTIVYTHAPAGQGPWPVNDIFAMNDDGSGVKALTRDGHSHNPAWSPDGRRILFIRDSALRTPPAYRETKEHESHHAVELYVMDAGGSNARLLRRIEPVIYSVAWSPDGKTLAITCLSQAPAGSESVRAGLYTLAADGRGELRLVAPNAFRPAWSPDGKRLAFSVENPRGRWTIHVADADGSHDVRLTGPDRISGSPAWSPDGRQIAFDQMVDPPGRQQVFVMDASGSNARQVTSDANWSCGHPSWSPDGRRLALGCRSTAPCGTISSVGTALPACDRRIFTLEIGDPQAKLTKLADHDGADPAYSPAR